MYINVTHCEVGTVVVLQSVCSVGAFWFQQFSVSCDTSLVIKIMNFTPSKDDPKVLCTPGSRDKSQCDCWWDLLSLLVPEVKHKSVWKIHFVYFWIALDMAVFPEFPVGLWIWNFMDGLFDFHYCLVLVITEGGKKTGHRKVQGRNKHGQILFC